MKITEKEIKNSTAQVEVIISKETVDHTKEHVVDEMIKSVTVKGFRQGKAPRAIAESNLSQEKLSNHIITHLLNDSVVAVIKDKNYKTLGRPVLEKLEPQKDGSIIIILNFPLYPEFKLGKYQDKLKNAKNKDKKADDVYDILLKEIKIDVPTALIDEEAKYSLDRLKEQAKTLNVTFEKYLESIKKSVDDIEKEYKKNAEESIKLDLILLKIAEDEKIEVGEEELNALSVAAGAKTEQLDQIKSIIKRRKTLDFLLKL